MQRKCLQIMINVKNVFKIFVYKVFIEDHHFSLDLTITEDIGWSNFSNIQESERFQKWVLTTIRKTELFTLWSLCSALVEISMLDSIPQHEIAAAIGDTFFIWSKKIAWPLAITSNWRLISSGWVDHCFLQ